jgi:hypothetical protein
MSVLALACDVAGENMSEKTFACPQLTMLDQQQIKQVHHYSLQI